MLPTPLLEPTTKFVSLNRVVRSVMLQMQITTYESFAHLGPLWSAVYAGFAVILFGTVYITPAGQRYLDSL